MTIEAWNDRVKLLAIRTLQGEGFEVPDDEDDLFRLIRTLTMVVEVLQRKKKNRLDELLEKIRQMDQVSNHFSEIFIVCKQGPEWNDIQSAHLSKSDAEKAVKALTEEIVKSSNTLDRLSTFTITPMVLV